MRPTRIPTSALLLLGAPLLLAGCGGGEAPGAQAEIPSDSLIRPMEREPLTEADLVGIAMTELALELPWTQNRVSRDAAAGAPAAGVEGYAVQAHDAFDRVIFTTADPLPATGYEIAIAEAGSMVSCGAESRELTARSLVVRFAPATPAGTMMAPGSGPGAGRMNTAGVACAAADTLVWVAELTGGDQVRVLELREPGRVAVDIR